MSESFAEKSQYFWKFLFGFPFTKRFQKVQSEKSQYFWKFLFGFPFTKRFQKVQSEKSQYFWKFLFGFPFTKTFQKVQWHNYDLIRSSLVQIHDIRKIFELLTKVIPFKMCQIDDGIPTKSL